MWERRNPLSGRGLANSRPKSPLANEARPSVPNEERSRVGRHFFLDCRVQLPENEKSNYRRTSLCHSQTTSARAVPARHTRIAAANPSRNAVDAGLRIRCVLDWEIGQSGDPMQDLGWVCVKTWRFGGKQPVGGFGTREDLFAAYEKESGHSVDPAHVRFWEAYGSVRWAIG